MMEQLVNLLLAKAKIYITLLRALDCEADSGGLNQFYRPNYPTPSGKCISGIYENIFTRCTTKSQFVDRCCCC